MLGSRVIRVSVTAIALGDTDNNIGAAGLRADLSAVITEAVEKVEQVYGENVAVAVMTEAVSGR